MNDIVRIFSPYAKLSDGSASERIKISKKTLGSRVSILAHHYQRADVYAHADLVGDSFKLAKLAASTSSEYLVFCGVHFMAEVADILSNSSQTVILPDLAA